MKFLFLILLFPLHGFAQDISGVWKGTMYNDTTKQYLQYELAINDNNGKLTGYSYTIFVIDGIKNVGVKSIKIKKGKDGFQVEDDKLIYNNYPEPPAKGVRTFSKLSFSEKKGTELLSGSWNTNRTKEYNSLTGTLSLERKTVLAETLIIPKLDEMGLITNLAFVTPDYKTNQTARNTTNSPTQTLPKKTRPNEGELKSIAVIASTKNDLVKEKNIESNSSAKKEINTGKNLIAATKQGSQKPSQVVANEKDVDVIEPTKNDLPKEKRIENTSLAKMEINTNNNLTAADKKDSQKLNQVLVNAKNVAITEPTKNDLEKEKNIENSSLTKQEINTNNNQIAANKQDSQKPNKIETNTKELATNAPTKNDLGKEEKNENNSSAKKEINTNINVLAANKQDSQKPNQLETNTKEIAVIPPTKNDLQKEKSTEISSSAKEKPNSNNNVIAANKKDPQQTNTVAGNTKELHFTPIINTTAIEKKDNNFLSPEKKFFTQTVNELPANQKEIKSNNFIIEAPIKSPSPTILAAAEIGSRKIETIQTVEIKQDSLVFSLFDNGIIDGDTVSILINGEVVWPRVGLLAKATNKTIYLTPEMGDSIFVVMYAENLGSIPPNTGLLVIREGNVDHEIRFSGDLKKNSAIILKRKKKE
jgi:hypothetical protein